MQSDRCARPDDLLGTLVDGRFRIVQHLSTGGVGELYVAEDMRARGRVKPCFAVKVLRPEHRTNELLLARFAREIEATSRIRDPHVMVIHHHGSLPNGVPYFVAELFEGMDLADILKLSGPLSPPRAVRLAMGIARGLAAAHAAGVVHRDLKPENVFVLHGADGRERVKLFDFGFAWIDDDPGEVHSGRLSVLHTAVGTPEYMSPEQALGDVGRPQADQYSLGIVLFEMLSGAPPFEGTRAQLVQKHAREIPPRPTRGSVELGDVVLRALAKDPSARFGSVMELTEALQKTEEWRGRTVLSSNL